MCEGVGKQRLVSGHFTALIEEKKKKGNGLQKLDRAKEKRRRANGRADFLARHTSQKEKKGKAGLLIYPRNGTERRKSSSQNPLRLKLGTLRRGGRKKRKEGKRFRPPSVARRGRGKKKTGRTHQNARTL